MSETCDQKGPTLATSPTRGAESTAREESTAEPATLGYRLLRAAREYGSRQAVSDGPVSLSFAELAESALAVAAALQAAGVAPGDRVAIWAPNSHHWIRTALGVYCAGAVLVPLNTRYRAAEAGELLTRTGAKVAVVHDGFLGFGYQEALLAPAQAGGHDLSGTLELVVDVSGAAPSAAPGAGPLVLDWDGFLRHGAGVPVTDVLARLDQVRPDDLSDVLFTSGTTGRAKGVRITHGSALRLYEDYGRIWGLRPGDRYLLSLPMFHAGGLKAGILTCLIHGVTAVPMAVFDIERMMEMIVRERITVLNGPPTVHYALLDHPAREAYDLHSLRLGATGAAVVPVEMVHRVQRELSYEHFITAYGMTECIGTATMCRSDDSAAVIAGSNGRAMPGVEIRVVDRDGADLPQGEQGEVLLRGFNTTRGYWDSPEESAALFDGDWLCTGDVGTLDDHGNLNITDRIKDLFLVGGFNVSPAEVEQILRTHPAVEDVAVTGVPDARLGEVGRAHVVLRGDAALTEGELIAWSRERMANFKVPRSVVFADALPRTASGKVVKGKLRTGAESAPGDTVEEVHHVATAE